MNLKKTPKVLLLLALTSLVTTLFWATFYFNLPRLLGFPNVTLETVFANYDGPNYMVIAKCGYVKDCIAKNFSLPQPLEYYPAHFPGFPLLIKTFSFLTTTPKAMLLATLLGSLFLTYTVFEFFKLKLKENQAFWLSIVFLFFPARLFVLRLVGAPETWFLATTLASIISFKNKKYILAALAASLSILFKSPGVILIFSYFVLALIELIKNKNLILILKKYSFFLLAPVFILLIFLLYQEQTGDFLAYFHSGDNIHLYLLPFPVFVSNRSWINTVWLEDVIYIFILSFYGIYRLLKKYHFDILAIYPLIFTFATLFVGHRDLSRYLAPIYPFLILSYSRILKRNPFRLIFFILIPAIILYAVNFVIGNTAPISDWTPYL